MKPYPVANKLKTKSIMEKKTNTITSREYLDMWVQILAGDSASPNGDKEQRLRRTKERLDGLLATLRYEVEN